VSLGAQSFDERRLASLGRIHSPEETRRAAEELHAAGLANFNLDLMYALPGQDVAAAIQDVEAALALSPAHISHYQLTIEHGTVFEAQPPVLPDDDVAADMLAECTRRVFESGFSHYEVSAYAREGRRCRHNLNYWTFGDYVGLGAGAHGKLTRDGAVFRTQQLREPRRYLASMPAAVSRSEVAAGDLPFEFMLNALRLVEGFEISLFLERTGLAWETVSATVEGLVGRGLLLQDEVRLKPTAEGLRFLNDLLLSFVPDQRRQRPKMSGPFALSTPS